MPALPQAVSQAWDARKGPIILTTVDENGTPNAIYASCVSKFAEDKLVVADNYFDKTRANIKAGTKGSLLFITEDNKAFQVKGEIEYHTDGEIYENMKSWLDPKHPGHAAAVLNVEAVYSGAERLL
jgi:hypothetical protein